MENSIAVTARDKQGKLIGYLKIISDDVYIYYILDVMVAPNKRGKGIGTKLMNAALKYCRNNGYMKIFITAIPGKGDFYKRSGFKPTVSGFNYPRRR